MLDIEHKLNQKVDNTECIPFFSHKEKPLVKDTNFTDGFFESGYRKVRVKDGIGYILAQGNKYGSKKLAAHKGRWINVLVENYWGDKAFLGRFTESGLNPMIGTNCPIIDI
jgi:hypothetical protein